MNLASATRSAAAGLGILFLIAAPVWADGFVSRTSHVLAYVGPGAGLGFIGSLLAILAVVFLGLVGLVAYPLKLILRMRRARSGAAAAEASHHDSTTD
jgi:hypothetical protein